MMAGADTFGRDHKKNAVQMLWRWNGRRHVLFLHGSIPGSQGAPAFGVEADVRRNDHTDASQQVAESYW